MISYEVYKLIHLVGIVLIFSGLVGLLTLKMANVAVEGNLKKFVFITHGIGMFLVLLGGFGLLARMGIARDIPMWAYTKLAIWLFFGGAISIVKRKGQLGTTLYIVLMAVFTLAAYLAINKPF